MVQAVEEKTGVTDPGHRRPAQPKECLTTVQSSSQKNKILMDSSTRTEKKRTLILVVDANPFDYEDDLDDAEENSSLTAFLPVPRLQRDPFREGRGCGFFSLSPLAGRGSG